MYLYGKRTADNYLNNLYQYLAAIKGRNGKQVHKTQRHRDHGNDHHQISYPRLSSPRCHDRDSDYRRRLIKHIHSLRRNQKASCKLCHLTGIVKRCHNRFRKRKPILSCCRRDAYNLCFRLESGIDGHFKIHTVPRVCHNHLTLRRQRRVNLIAHIRPGRHRFSIDGGNGVARLKPCERRK